MRKQFSKLALTASIVLAMAFTFGCSSNSDVSQLVNSNRGEDYSSSVHSDNSSSSNNNENNGSSSSSANSGYNSSVQSSSSVSEGCEDIIFNPLTSFCYENNVYSKCNGMVFNPTTHICQGTVANPAKCNGIQYNPLENSCCVSAIFSLANQRCQNSVVETKCGTSWYNATNMRCENGVIETKCGTNGWYDASNTNLRCESDVVETKCGTNWYNVETLETLSCSNGTLFMTDSRDNQTYKVAIIGTQTWVAQNLNYNADGSKCYNNSENNCTTYGRLYDWATAMTVCPSGWHLPNNAEWRELRSFVGGYDNAGTKLKATNLWNSFEGKSGNGTNNYGFSALPGGAFWPVNGVNYGFRGVGINGEWWSASDYNAEVARYASMSYREESMSIEDGQSKSDLISVRCVQD
ncbi:MAG: fibrobacter succinogenes major paralogous domain-containing protein [Fibromonadaceae bacterium]|jgi:uncharacterized protein (TIGR02145 family)|nr:fibrobacter succinogenes major paralogous domain-containing protein [Fibromonadaceae bacterium]